MVLAKTSILIVAILVGCYLTFIAAVIVGMYYGIKSKKQVRKYWAEKGVKLGLFWNPAIWCLIDDPEYNKIRNKINKVSITCVIIAFLSGAVVFLIVFLVES